MKYQRHLNKALFVLAITVLTLLIELFLVVELFLQVKMLLFIGAIFTIVLSYIMYEIFNIKKNINKEKKEIYSSMTYASNHILRNLLQQMQIIKLEALTSDDFNKDAINMFDESVNEAKQLLQKLSSVKQLDKINILKSIHPVR